MKVKDFIDAEPDADGCYTSPITGLRVQPWREWYRDEKGVVTMQFRKGRDAAPVGDVLLFADRNGNIVGGCMAETFRYYARHDGYGTFTFAPCLPPNAVAHLFEVCSKPRCFQEATIRDRDGSLYCSDHGLEAMADA
jgi:hypothetical protein